MNTDQGIFFFFLNNHKQEIEECTLTNYCCSHSDKGFIIHSRKPINKVTN